MKNTTNPVFYQRMFKPPKQSFFLFGPRGTGKTTWIRKIIQPALNINLLKTTDFLELEAQPELLRKKVEALDSGSWILIDEIQKIPILLDEIQDLLVDYDDTYNFALTGSSARKLKRVHANLLAGRAFSKSIFPLNSQELNFDFNLTDILKFGSLPKIFRMHSDDDKKEYLNAYVNTYIKEEIQQESIVRNLHKYHRFLRHSAILNGQILNLSDLSREVGVQRSTIDGYFQILKDTLLTFELPASILKAKVKEIAAPKVYFFDCGVTSALLNKLDDSTSDIQGTQFETFILNEIRSTLSYKNISHDLEYWGAHQGGEIDIILTLGKKRIGIEIKTAKKYSSNFSKHLANLLELKKIDTGLGVYWGKDAIKDKGVYFFSLMEFLKKLHNGDLF